MKGKAIITFPDGTTYTRSTDRPYSWGIAYRVDENAEARIRATESLKNNTRTLPEYEAVVASGKLPAEYRSLTLADYRRFVADAKEAIAEAKATLATIPAEPKLTEWRVSKMSGSRLLAEKALAQGADPYTFSGAVVDAQVLPVVFTPATPKADKFAELAKKLADPERTDPLVDEPEPDAEQIADDLAVEATDRARRRRERGLEPEAVDVTPTCGGCERKIVSPLDGIVLGRAVYHRSCFRCYSCREPFETRGGVPVPNRVHDGGPGVLLCDECDSADKLGREISDRADRKAAKKGGRS